MNNNIIHEEKEGLIIRVKPPQLLLLNWGLLGRGTKTKKCRKEIMGKLID
jgi:hypothetical protein